MPSQPRGYHQIQINSGGKPVKYIISLLIGAAACVWGSRYVFGYLKREDKELCKKHRILISAGGGVLFAAVAVLFPLLISGADMSVTAVFRAMILIYFLYFIAIIDFRLKIIPNCMLLIMLGVMVPCYLAELILVPGSIRLSITAGLLGGAMCFVIFLVGKLISRKGMGMGDIKLAAVMGLYLGIDNALGCMLWAMIFGAVTGVVLIASKKLKPKSKIAMGPFFFAGVLMGHIMYIISGIMGGQV